MIPPYRLGRARAGDPDMTARADQKGGGGSAGSAVDLDDVIQRAGEHLSELSVSLPSHFGFIWRARKIRVRLDAPDGTGADLGAPLAIRIDLGILPYTAEDKALRSNIQNLVGKAEQDGPGRLAIRGGRNLVYDIEDQLKVPVSTVDLVTRLTVNLLQSQSCLSYLDNRPVQDDAGADKPFSAEREQREP